MIETFIKQCVSHGNPFTIAYCVPDDDPDSAPMLETEPCFKIWPSGTCTVKDVMDMATAAGVKVLRTTPYEVIIAAGGITCSDKQQ